MSNMTYSPYGSLKVVGDIDTERLIQERMRSSSFGDSIGDMRQRLREFRHVEFAFEVPAGAIPLTRTVERFPYVPSEAMACDELCYEAYNIQVHGLTKRLKATGIERVVIGVSGGLDSTHALIVCAKTMDLLGHSRKNILAYTMPGFATSNRTKASAHRLMEALGVTAEELDIRPSCLQMMKDIGHPYGKGEQVFDVTFENVQAGERTSHLFRLANLHKALVVGTGDLSELALGWATYGVGDHMSHYNVNASVPKTLIQHLIRWVIRTSQLGPGAGVVLQTVLDTEISPELVPPIGDESQPAQSTQASIGPYELQDFNLYYTTRYGFRPSKIAFLALHAWADKDRGPWLSLIPDRRRNEYDLGTIVHWLEVFLYRFFKISQFKRSAMPNGPKVGCGGSLSPRGDWRAPSDSEAVVWLDEIHRSMAACQSGQESRDDKPKVAILNLLDHQASPGQVERIEVG
jgi:NAD+ synthase (glutamine-hydrolysing)